MTHFGHRAAWFALLAGCVPSVHAQEPLRGMCVWRLEETTRIGSLDGDQALSEVLDLAIGPTGNLYVAQQSAPYVTVLSDEGTLLRRLGRAGGGPGEFNGWPLRLGWIGDTLWVTDHRTTKLLTARGEEIRRIAFGNRVAREGSLFIPGPPLANGTLLPRRLIVGNAPVFFTVDSLSLPRFDGDGVEVGTIARLPQPMRVRLEGDEYSTHPLADWMGLAALPMAPVPDGRGVVFVREGPSQPRSWFDVIRIDMDGDTVFVRRIEHEPRPVTSRERDWFRSRFAASVAGDYLARPSAMMGDRTRERRRREAASSIEFPRYHPPVRRIVVGIDGSLWLLREASPPELVDVWEVYGPQGLEGRIRIETGRSGREPWGPRLNLHRASRDEVWGVSIDDLEVPYIHRYNVNRSCR